MRSIIDSDEMPGKCQTKAAASLVKDHVIFVLPKPLETIILYSELTFFVSNSPKNEAAVLLRGRDLSEC
jgi:hypothetical protein